MISIIVPYWESEAWLGRCCKSLTQQKGDFEFILVNDHSTDGGESIAMEYAEFDDRFILLNNERNKGVSGARNTGLDHAHGEWITFLDADDELLPKAYLVFGHMIRFNEEANIVQANHLRHYERIARTVSKYPNYEGVYTFDDMCEQWCMVWNKLYRAEIIGDTRFVEDFQYGEDELFNLEILAKDGRIFHVDRAMETTLRHFENKGSLSHIKGKAELIQQAHALEDFLLRSNNAEANNFALRVLTEHFSSPTYKKAFTE